MSARNPVTPLDAGDVEHFDHETDVLIVGYGCAGAEVVLLEKASGDGGSSALSGGEMYLGLSLIHI